MSGTLITADGYNQSAIYYNTGLGTGFPLKNAGDLISYYDWAYMLAVITMVVPAQGRTFLGPLPNASYYVAGGLIVPQGFPAFSGQPPVLNFLYTSNGSFTVPAGYHTIQVEASGGGGGGGGAVDHLNGSGGGGGGAGGYVVQSFGVTAGDSITAIIGGGAGGGFGYNPGGPGGTTSIYINGNLAIALPGGSGGGAGAVGGEANPGGIGGAPGGGTGSIGPGGASDTASCPGGAGGSNAFGGGGAGGGLGQNGGDGQAYGAGGGGAGYLDRVSPFYWTGGTGHNGVAGIIVAP